MKKLLAGLLSLALLLSCLPMSVLAAEAADTEESVVRYTVLVLDTSSTSTFIGSDGEDLYTAGTALSYVKKASDRFLDNISDNSGENYVAVVSYQDTASVVSDFTQDFDSLKEKIDSISASSTTRSIAAGLESANELLQDISEEDVVKNVVLFTTGMTNAGDYNYTGQYDSDTTGAGWYRTDTEINLYAYANAAVEQANALKENGIYVYTIGLFQTMEEMPDEGLDVVELFKLTANDLATSDNYYYPVDDPDNLEFAFGEVADDIANPLKKITFTYQSGKDYTATCYYTNNYFADSSYTYNSSLATMSLSFAMSAFGSSQGGQSDYSNKSVNAKQLLMDIGVKEDNIEINDWFTTKPTTDSIGVIAGNMPISVDDESYTLVALAVRGGGYESEWASNFTVGTSGQHNGFNTAKNNVISFLKEYIKDQGITGKVKLWITGYSRAAATANLVGGAIDQGIVISSDITYDCDDVYTYCFETPAGALTSQVKGQTKYYNIFNIINSSDPVPYVAPAALGFGRYGIDHYLPSKESSSNYTTLKKKMLAVYSSLDSTDSYIVDDFQMKKLAAKNWLPGGEKISFVQDDTKNNYSQGVFLSNYITILAKDFFQTRSNYVSVYQDEIREICSVMFGGSDAQSKIMMDSIVSQAKDEWPDLVKSYIWNTGINPWGTEDDALQIVSDWLKQAVQDAEITDYDEDTIDAAGKDLADLMLALITNHPNYFTTAIMNGSGLGAAHYPELCYSWLASMDPNYTKGAETEFNNGGYRIVHINCAVDVEVADSDGNVIAAIVDEEPDTTIDSSYVYGIDEDGQKYVVLPVDCDYTITITGREDDLVNYSVSEYSALAGDYTRNVNYFNIDLKCGETLTGTIPAYSEEEITEDTPDGSTAEYTLLDPDHDLIESDSDKNGSEASNDVFTINAVSSDYEKGIVTGSGIRYYGTFAQVEATARKGYRFVGWYSNNELVSTDEAYRVCVTGDVELVGRFEEDPDVYTVYRYYGDNRYETAIESAEALKETMGVDQFDSVVIASGVNFPDALAGSPLAAQIDAPILLVGSNDANKGQAQGTAETIEYVESNLTAGGTVYILGGTSAVSEQTETTLQNAGFKTVRLAGEDRYETNLEIISQMDLYEGMDVVIVRGYTSYKTSADKAKKTNPQGYADSLSVSGVAGYYGMPIILAGEKGLTEDQMDLLAQLKPTNIYVIGGTSAVSDAVYAQIENGTTGTVKRIAGDDRYQTSVAIAEEFGMENADAAVIAYGQNYPDGLTGGVLAAKLGAPLLLAEKGKTSAQQFFLKESTITDLYVLGGEAVLSNQTISDLIK